MLPWWASSAFHSGVAASVALTVIASLPDAKPKESLRRENVAVERDDVADAADRDVSRRIGFKHPCVGRVMSLPRKDGRHLVAPDGLHRGQNAQLVVDQHVATGGIEPLDRVKLLLLVNEDENLAVERAPQTRSLDLARLEDGVAVGQDHDAAPLAHVADRLQRAGIEPLGERIVDQPVRQPEQARFVRDLAAVALERAEIVGVAQGGEPLLEDRPIPVARRCAVSLGQMRLEVVLDAIVVDQRVVHVEQEDDVVHDAPHADGSGLRHGPYEPISSSAASGPQVPGSYSTTGGGFLRTASTIRHCASTMSSRLNNSPSPRIASP